ncbi:MAG: hypothetical protein ACOYXW_03335 [Actinomycetota bacterium]|nr:hypothetical protein HJG43_06975 [Kineosporiaceae bacterium SCSIO 59966]
MSPGSRRAVVLHDARLSLPELWNWLVDCGAHCAGGAVPSHECTAPQAGTQDATST